MGVEQQQVVHSPAPAEVLAQANDPIPAHAEAQPQAGGNVTTTTSEVTAKSTDQPMDTSGPQADEYVPPIVLELRKTNPGQADAVHNEWLDAIARGKYYQRMGQEKPGHPVDADRPSDFPKNLEELYAINPIEAMCSYYLRKADDILEAAQKAEAIRKKAEADKAKVMKANPTPAEAKKLDEQAKRDRMNAYCHAYVLSPEDNPIPLRNKVEYRKCDGTMETIKPPELLAHYLVKNMANPDEYPYRLGMSSFYGKEAKLRLYCEAHDKDPDGYPMPPHKPGWFTGETSGTHYIITPEEFMVAYRIMHDEHLAKVEKSIPKQPSKEEAEELSRQKAEEIKAKTVAEIKDKRQADAAKKPPPSRDSSKGPKRDDSKGPKPDDSKGAARIQGKDKPKTKDEKSKDDKPTTKPKPKDKKSGDEAMEVDETAESAKSKSGDDHEEGEVSDDADAPEEVEEQVEESKSQEEPTPEELRLQELDDELERIREEREVDNEDFCENCGQDEVRSGGAYTHKTRFCRYYKAEAKREREAFNDRERQRVRREKRIEQQRAIITRISETMERRRAVLGRSGGMKRTSPRPASGPAPKVARSGAEARTARERQDSGRQPPKKKGKKPKPPTQVEASAQKEQEVEEVLEQAHQETVQDLAEQPGSSAQQGVNNPQYSEQYQRNLRRLAKAEKLLEEHNLAALLAEEPEVEVSNLGLGGLRFDDPPPKKSDGTHGDDSQKDFL